MNYQVGNDQQQNTYNPAFTMGIHTNNSDINSNSDGAFSGNQVGDLLACTLIKGGKEPVLDMNGVQIKTKAAKELENAEVGDTIYLKIQKADTKQVALKIVGTKSQHNIENLNMATNVQIMQTTEQLSEMIKENIDGALDEKVAKENQKEILRSLSTEEIAKLRRMQIDVTNATLSDLLGMVITIRSNRHQDEKIEQLENTVKNTMDRLEKNIPVQDKNTTSKIDPIVTDEQLVYLVKNNMDLTIENYEKARNSVNEESPSKILPLNNQIWNDIYPQVLGIIEAEGRNVTAQNLSGAQFMLQHELPITVDSLRLYMSVNALNQRGIKKSQVEANINEQIAMGNPPEQARISGSTIHEKAEQIVEKVETITSIAINKAVEQNKLLTISYLYNSSMRNVDVHGSGRVVHKGVEGASLSLSGIGKKEYEEGNAGTPLFQNPEAIIAKRQLEEIRLSMTMEAAIRLVRQDINIDAKPLSRIVELLRNQENMYYENVVSAHDLHDIPEGLDLLKETLKETDSLKILPEYALGEIVKKPAITIGGLYQKATQMKAVLVGNAYETMMTRPRADMGDSIKEAFRNINDILTDMDMERNEENQRAIRILSYNQMELSEKNIISVKVADAKIQQMFETLTPQIVLNLIRENKNPINMTIDGLNEEIMHQKELLGVTDEQRFSEFLYQMDRMEEITKEERKSFIGIYRLLDKIEKSHGKDIGTVIRNGQEITLNNLFAATKSRKAQGFDVKVDENLGERIDVSTSEASILNQIEIAYNQTLTNSIMRHIRPEILKSMEELDYHNMTFEEMNTIMKAVDQGQGETELVKELSDTLQEAFSYEDEVEMMLQANEMPKTATNILAVHQVMYEQNGIYDIIRNMKGNLPKEQRQKITETENKILETLESKEDVIYGLEKIRAGLSEAIHDKEAEGTITAKDIQALKYLNAGMPIAMRAVEEDVFQVPLVIGEQVSIMKVSILQNGSKAGDIKATVNTSRYGKLESYIHVEGNQIEGYVSTEEEAGQGILEGNELTLRSAFAKVGMETRDLRLDGTKPERYGSEIKKEEVSTAKLYKVAKQLLTAIKLTGIVTDN